jgi:endonuclease YncB( thermonuclease family)
MVHQPIDGDTFAYGPQRIRVQGLNAPELADPGGFEASQRLASLLREGPVRIVPKATDRYGRTVAQVFVNDRDVASVLKSEGYAPR